MQTDAVRGENLVLHGGVLSSGEYKRLLRLYSGFGSRDALWVQNKVFNKVMRCLCKSYMTKEEFDLITKKMSEGTATKEDADAFLAEISRFLGEVTEEAEQLEAVEAKENGKII